MNYVDLVVWSYQVMQEFNLMRKPPPTPHTHL